jgi:hypothetical protein
MTVIFRKEIKKVLLSLTRFNMRKSIFLILLLFIGIGSYAQPTTALDFSMVDCNGQFHNLYSELDSGNAIIMEFWMDGCSPCVVAGKALDSMYKELKLSCSHVRYFQTVFNNTSHCNVVFNWVNTNGFSSVPFDSGAAQVAYYGGFGMPTVAVAAGNTHQLLYLNNHGFPTGDTAVVAASIKSFCLTGIKPEENNFSFSVYPNPTKGEFILHDLPSQAQRLRIVDVFGKTIFQTELNNNKVPVILNAPDGIYFLRIETQEGVCNKKIILCR